MATFYHGKPEIQPVDGLQTLYLMNPTYVGYSADASATSPANSNMAFLNSTVMGNSIGQANLSLAQQQHFVGIPLHQQPESVGDHGLDRRAQYQLWNFADHQRTTSTISTPSNQGGLSLSFSTEQHKNYAIQPPNSQLPTAVLSNRGEDQVKFSGSSSSLASGVLIGSKYLKVAQELLDEVVSVSDKGVKDEPSKTTKPAKAKDEDGSNSGGDKSTKRAGAELTTVERQEIQMKKAKLVHMLDEVEQRYRHYHHQMQIVMSSIDTIAGLGSARTYTALALKTISRQFRCLRDAISGQIRSASNSLGEEDCLTRSRSEGGSRLRFVDYQLRQQRALQQLGMMHQNAWRPQRGLPERSVSILRAWLFEHFLHPYPKDCDKHMLAKQTGLTRNQVSNWFINARVRLWKPMVEDMYLEETKEKEHHNNNNGENKSNNREEEFEPKSTFGTEQLSIPTPSSRIQTGYDDEEEGAAEEEEEEEEIIPSNIKKSRTTDHNHHHHHQIPQLEMDMKPMDRPNNRDHHNHHHHLLDRCFNNSGGSGGYFINEMSRFLSTDQFGQPQYSTTNGGVSLTLGLQHCEGLQFSGAQPTYLFTDPDDYSSGGNNIKPLMSPPPNAYESLSLQNRKRFAAPQLLKDFVA